MADTLKLTTTGRRTGKARSTPLRYRQRNGDLVVAASNGGRPENPQWYSNLLADPDVRVELDGERFKARARTATGAERDELWRLLVAGFPAFADYQRSLERRIPVVVLERSGR
jgi:deazaflavin-dependent oxidoreductase (nitroreductase family)